MDPGAPSQALGPPALSSVQSRGSCWDLGRVPGARDTLSLTVGASPWGSGDHGGLLETGPLQPHVAHPRGVAQPLGPGSNHCDPGRSRLYCHRSQGKPLGRVAAGISGKGVGSPEALAALWAQPTPPGRQGPLLLSLPRDSACFLLWVPDAPHPHTRVAHTPTIPHSPTPRAQPRAHTHTEGCATAAGGRVTARCRRSRPHPGCPSHSALRTRGWAAPLKPRRERGLTRMGLLRALGRAGRPSSPQAPPDLSHQLLPSSTFSRNRA